MKTKFICVGINTAKATVTFKTTEKADRLLAECYYWARYDAADKKALFEKDKEYELTEKEINALNRIDMDND